MVLLFKDILTIVTVSFVVGMFAGAALSWFFNK